MSTQITQLFLEPYYWSSLAIAVMLALYIAQIIVGDLAQDAANHPAGAPPTGNQDSFLFRAMRAPANSLENIPFFIFLIMMCILTEAHSGLTNTLAILAMISRSIHMAAYYADKRYIRGYSWMGGTFVMLVLSLALLWNLVTTA